MSRDALVLGAALVAVGFGIAIAALFLRKAN